ncbi:23S rRNA (uracil(1939)-C(5))-methyltransferase RlmD [Paramaledivibacter caminithermalis]|uniref:23S rRNA (Uracil1939-C5)-methyltransferase n=1 Tax=Paramaledivibacter caminithermalis (strain DSM 15212 / CIP 107654 / DViRD3) TaxID=1121301 RepID=A0A1M6TSA5_PARC5|nr:23S rRNA (uracil(1939)-C(5))-methyltransferase RlmD [Paramaledivibacter caminithermalis]SHK59698.1 23S rRNA (uracil1939-C5)-methyltransferase [Paramaledivibacter caminithermalis DSM 15212]
MTDIPVKEGKKYELIIHDIGDGGEGIGEIEGFTIFIEGGIPKDKLLVEITKVKKNYALGKIIEVKELSPYRIKPICAIADKCGGCQIQHIDYARQLEIKKNKVISNIDRIGKLENVLIHDVLGMNEPYRYRNKAQFPIGMENGKSIIGFYKKRTHEIVNIVDCSIHHEINDKILMIFKRIIDENKISVYEEKSGKGLLRHILTRVSHTTGDLMVVIITNGKKLPFKEKIVNELIKNVPKVKSIVQNINIKKTNVILGRECITLYGHDKIVDYIGDLRFEISPLSFFQVNPFQTKVLYDKVLEYAELTGNETVFDIYCGIGTISLFLAQRAKKVYGIEVIEAAIKDAKRNAKLNNLDNTEFFVGKAEELVPKLYKQGLKADVVVVDPPRKGCDKVVLEMIAVMKPKRVIYVSCKPSTLARDLRILNELGYKTLEVQPVDMFPHTTHVECCVRIRRKE